MSFVLFRVFRVFGGNFRDVFRVRSSCSIMMSFNCDVFHVGSSCSIMVSFNRGVFRVRSSCSIMMSFNHGIFRVGSLPYRKTANFFAA